MDAPTKPSPPDVVYFGVFNDRDGPIHVFRCESYTLTIQTRSFLGQLGQNSERRQEYRDNTAFDVEIIQTMLGSIEWGRTNYAYLVRESSGSYRLMYRNKVPRPLTCHLWAPTVDIKEIDVTRWLDQRIYREGIWRGREVNLKIMDSPESWVADMVSSEIDGARTLTALGYSFEVLGIVTSNGGVVGIMYEIPVGRVVQYHDRAALYDAFADLQKHRVVYRGITTTNVIITDKGVRLLDASTVLVFGEDEDEDLERYGETWHWERLAKLFEEYKQRPNVMPLAREVNAYKMVIPRLPSLYRELILDPEIIVVAMLEYRFKKQLDPARYSQRQWQVALRMAMKKVDGRLASSSWDIQPSFVGSESSRTLSDTSGDVYSALDKPRTVNRSIPRLRVTAEVAFHPYSRSKARPIRRILAPDLS
ncbi:hypothetical protein GLOTRDRAFT_60723 [Gloeophyllum trabeum ATCC 11539]|uniref:Uncharacterized protein n=1 Tax=Gloeophyllum trabeum (strain ATCC 11539 / FP-39264 / Madison 617) TaxID=670483 RepID=S7RSB6_GLOTA|nr:uncharacterized protein GLOTRDRAFT_60723 [Gloeophyllum trabeum ATCC 11539]EPQ55924.1 hypothetical protein GLOTRDRAFT_60723 [Gloeophyllum trabeum ATCC 11539]